MLEKLQKEYAITRQTLLKIEDQLAQLVTLKVKHQGQLELLAKMIKEAKEAGVTEPVVPAQ